MPIHSLPVCDKKNLLQHLEVHQSFRLDVLFAPPTFERRLASTQEGGFDKYAPRFAIPWPPLASHLWQFRLLVKKIFCIQLIVLKYSCGGVSGCSADTNLAIYGMADSFKLELVDDDKGIAAFFRAVVVKCSRNYYSSNCCGIMKSPP